MRVCNALSVWITSTQPQQHQGGAQHAAGDLQLERSDRIVGHFGNFGTVARAPI
jgi:hypothetical protein